MKSSFENGSAEFNTGPYNNSEPVSAYKKASREDSLYFFDRFFHHNARQRENTIKNRLKTVPPLESSKLFIVHKNHSDSEQKIVYNRNFLTRTVASCFFASPEL